MCNATDDCKQEMVEDEDVLKRERGVSPFLTTIILCSCHSLDRIVHHLKTLPGDPMQVIRALLQHPDIQFVQDSTQAPFTEKWRVSCFEFIVVRQVDYLFGMEVVKVKTCWRVLKRRSRPRYRDDRAKEKQGWRKKLPKF